MSASGTAHENWQISGDGPANYERYTVARMFRPLAEVLLRELELRPGLRVLDVACGTGVIARLAAPLVAPGGTVVGIDVNEQMLAAARALSAQAQSAIEYRQADAHALPFQDASFDIVVCQQGLQFFRDRLCALREMSRVLAHGGSIGIAVFAEPDLFIRSLFEALGAYVDAKTQTQVLAPFALADGHALRSLARQAGIRKFEMRTVSLQRRVEPSQQWLLEFSAGLPYGPAIAAMAGAERAAMIRDVAARLNEFWKSDHFALRAEVHILCARREAATP